MASTRCFLGGNTAEGFFSLYDGFCAGEEDFLWIIKGGPGCGKSSFMRTVGRAAEQAGLDVEYVLCSGDPDSLDGVYLTALHTGYVDGTAPHALEVRLPGAGGSYLDLGQFYDRAALHVLRKELAALFARYRACYAEVYRILAPLTPPEGLPACSAGCRRRFARAVTCRGIVQAEPAPARTLTKAELTELLAQPDTVRLQHPLFPQLTEGVQLGRDFCLLPPVPTDGAQAAVAKLREAKALHDELEALYNPHVDFSGVYALAQAHAARLQNENPVVMRPEM